MKSFSLNIALSTIELRSELAKWTTKQITERIPFHDNSNLDALDFLVWDSSVDEFPTRVVQTANTWWLAKTKKSDESSTYEFVCDTSRERKKN